MGSAVSEENRAKEAIISALDPLIDNKITEK
jgi:hypothetical protein